MCYHIPSSLNKRPRVKIKVCYKGNNFFSKEANYVIMDRIIVKHLDQLKAIAFNDDVAVAKLVSTLETMEIGPSFFYEGPSERHPQGEHCPPGHEGRNTIPKNLSRKFHHKS